MINQTDKFPLNYPDPETWAYEYGEDEYGLWSSLLVEDTEYVFRWIFGGDFLMGSPTFETGRFDTCRVLGGGGWGSSGRHAPKLHDSFP